MNKNKEIKFFCAWGKDKGISWSGTNLSVLNALKKYYEIEEFDIGLFNNTNKLSVLLCRLKNKIKYKIFHESDFSINQINLFNKILNKELQGKKCIGFQFSECPNLPNVRSYVYQDLHVGYVKEMIDTMPEIFKVSGYQHLNKDIIYKREKMQRKFYEQGATVLTMGHWLEKELVEKYGLQRENVYCVGGGV